MDDPPVNNSNLLINGPVDRLRHRTTLLCGVSTLGERDCGNKSDSGLRLATANNVYSDAFSVCNFNPKI